MNHHMIRLILHLSKYNTDLFLGNKRNYISRTIIWFMSFIKNQYMKLKTVKL